jgi:hypothetical protein
MTRFPFGAQSIIMPVRLAVKRPDGSSTCLNRSGWSRAGFPAQLINLRENVMAFTSRSRSGAGNTPREPVPLAELLTIAATLLNIPAMGVLLVVIVFWPHLPIPPGRHPFLPLLLVMLAMTIILLSIIGVSSGWLQMVRRRTPWNLPGLCLILNVLILLGLAGLGLSGFQLQ